MPGPDDGSVSSLGNPGDHPTDVTHADFSRDTEEMFLRSEQTGLKLTIIGRTVALVSLPHRYALRPALDQVRLRHA